MLMNEAWGEALALRQQSLFARREILRHGDYFFFPRKNSSRRIAFDHRSGGNGRLSESVSKLRSRCWYRRCVSLLIWMPLLELIGIRWLLILGITRDKLWSGRSPQPVAAFAEHLGDEAFWTDSPRNHRSSQEYRALSPRCNTPTGVDNADRLCRRCGMRLPRGAARFHAASAAVN